MGKSLLTISRSVGLDNISQLQNLRRAIRAGRAGQYHAHFELNSNLLDEFMPSPAVKNMNTYMSIPNMIRRLLPKSTSDKAKTSVDVLFNRLGTKESSPSSFLTATGVTRLAESIINRAELRVIKNQAGTLLSFIGDGESKISSRVSMYVSDRGSNKVDKGIFIKSLKYTENGSTGKLTVNMPQQNGRIRHFNSEISAPVEFFDSYVLLNTNGNHKSFKSFIAGAQRFIRGN